MVKLKLSNMINNKLLRIYRALIYLVNYFFFEIPFGLNISPRSKLKGITLKGNNGYALTAKAALKNILKNINLENLKFLDIGSGKGGVVIFSYQLGCASSTGIEYEKFLHELAVNNISKLKYNNHCFLENLDARNFKKYAEYDILFMFNPFVLSIYEEVVKEIKMQIENSKILKTRYLICYGETNIEAINNSVIFKLIEEYLCPYRGNIYRKFKTYEMINC